jgi:Serine aminopeptidase, S33
VISIWPKPDCSGQRENRSFLSGLTEFPFRSGKPLFSLLPSVKALPKGVTMPYITVGQENGADIDIYYKDWGSGQPVVFSHGWPLSADDWDAQMLFFAGRGFRVIAHDRRGHGRSSHTSGGHDMDHYADDLAALTAHLDST